MLIANEEFDALVALLDSDPNSAGNIAARAVLVEGVRQAEAMRSTGISRSAVCNAVKRFREADTLIRSAYKIEVRRDGETVSKEPLWTVVRYPNGTWRCVEHLNNQDCVGCETWQVSANSKEKAIAKAQQKRSRTRQI